ncbi:MAG: MoxR family ATPase [archaeon]|nr:MoxR family ATPase [archaeon]
MDKEIKELNKKAETYSKDLDTILAEIQKVVVGQKYPQERLMLSLISNGHILLEGLPGLAKTLMISTLSDCVHADFRRIQFTPDLLPADITGTKIYNQNTAKFTTKRGPIFANFILADEINRAPPKVQSALLEAMQERQVTISGETYTLPHPFLVMATQNPLETEGTYTLPEAQIDRFMFKVNVDYPTKSQEKDIINRMTGTKIPTVDKIISPMKIIEIQKFNLSIYIDDKIKNYITDIVQATRTPKDFGLDISQFVEYGASPRASLWLALGGKAHALMSGRGYVTPEDIKSIAPDVLRHRIILSYEALAEDVKVDAIIDQVLKSTKVP